MPPQLKDSFLASLRLAKETKLRAVVDSTRQRQNSAWDHWANFCAAHNIDSFLTGVQGAEAILQVFLLCVRQGTYNTSRQQVRAGTVAKYLTAISQRIISMVEADTRNKAVGDGSYHYALKKLLKAFARSDPPTNRVWPINVRILEELWNMPPPPGFSPAMWRRIQDMCVIGFFFMLRPGEYAKPLRKDTRSQPFRLSHVYFLHPINKDLPAILPGDPLCNDSNVLHAGLKFDDQKSGYKGDMVTHSATGRTLCPVSSLKRICREITDHMGGITTPLYNYYEPQPSRGHPHFMPLESSDLTSPLHLAAGCCQQETGIPPDKISARSLRAGGATALLCAKVSKDIVSLLGHWRGDSVDIYMRTNTHTFTTGYSTQMYDSGSYKFASFLDNGNWAELHDLIPDDAPTTSKTPTSLTY